MVRGKDDHLGLFLAASLDSFCQDRHDVSFSITVLCPADLVSSVKGGEMRLAICCSAKLLGGAMHAQEPGLPLDLGNLQLVHAAKP